MLDHRREDAARCPTCPPGLVRRPPGLTRRVIESYGFDPTLCGMGGDASGSLLRAGLRVPPLPTTARGLRYYFRLASMQVGYGQRAWIVGLGQSVQIGIDTNAGAPPVFPMVKPVGRLGAGNKDWSFSDGNIVFGLRFIREKPLIPWGVQNILSCDSFSWRWSDGPALLFETATFGAGNLDFFGHPDNYLSLTGYSPPNGGAFQGEPLGGYLGKFTGIDFPMDVPSKQAIEPIEVEGPGVIVFDASVWQTNPATRATLTVPTSWPIDPEIPEDGFVVDFSTTGDTPTGPNYWSIAGKLVVET